MLSSVRGSVTNNNGFWIGWLDLLALRLQLQPIITAHNQWPLTTRSIPYWTTRTFPSARLTLFSFTDRSLLLRLPWTTTVLWTNSDWLLLSVLTWPLFITSGEPNRDHLIKQLVAILLLFVFCPLLQNVFYEPLSSNGLFRLSGVMAHSLSRKRVLMSRCLANGLFRHNLFIHR
jgi:hypothetical protein